MDRAKAIRDSKEFKDLETMQHRAPRAEMRYQNLLRDIRNAEKSSTLGTKMPNAPSLTVDAPPTHVQALVQAPASSSFTNSKNERSVMIVTSGVIGKPPAPIVATTPNTPAVPPVAPKSQSAPIANNGQIKLAEGVFINVAAVSDAKKEDSTTNDAKKEEVKTDDAKKEAAKNDGSVTDLTIASVPSANAEQPASGIKQEKKSGWFGGIFGATPVPTKENYIAK